MAGGLSFSVRFKGKNEVQRRAGLWSAVCITLIWSCAVAAPADAQDLGNEHLKLENPANLPAAEIEALYGALRNRLMEGYALSRLPGSDKYLSWTRYNTAPYLSQTHGQRFVNNYANAKAQSYGKLKEGEKLPVGSVLAKDSITLTDTGKTFPGALSIMEKLEAGKSPETADWRYVVVNPDGSLLGDTIGDEPELVEYCHTCHEAEADNDYTFFVPKEYRIDN